MKNRHSIDGFIPRKPGEQLGGLHRTNARKAITDKEVPESKLLHNEGGETVRMLGEEQSGHGLGRSDIDESLSEIDGATELTKKLSRRQRRKMANQLKRPRSLKNRIIRWALSIIAIIILAGGGYAAFKFIIAGNNIFQGSIFDLFQSQPLKEDSNGRSNFLILGTSEDDPGHGGADLTDSMMVVSINQKNKDIYMFSIPRDLYVEYGEACLPGYAGKINAYFSCAQEGTSKSAEQNRLVKTQKLVGKIFGLDIQYGIHVN